MTMLRGAEAERQPLLATEKIRGVEREDLWTKKVVFMVVGAVSVALVVCATAAASKPGPAIVFGGNTFHDDGNNPSSSSSSRKKVSLPHDAWKESHHKKACPRASSPSKSCALVDRSDWCESKPHTSNLRSLCFSACAGDVTWMEHCAWQVVHDLPRVCAGTFQPKPPDGLDRIANVYPAEEELLSEEDDDSEEEETEDYDGEELKDECSRLAMCGGCDGEPTDHDSFCSTVVLHYENSDPSALFEESRKHYSRALERAVDDDLDEWCRALGIQRTWSSPTQLGDALLTTTWTTAAWTTATAASASSEEEEDSSSPPIMEIEEHYLYGSPPERSSIFIKQAYAFWRFVLNGPRASAGPGRSLLEAEDEEEDQEEDQDGTPSDEEEDEGDDDDDDEEEDEGRSSSSSLRRARKRRRWELLASREGRPEVAVKTRSYMSRKALERAVDEGHLKAGAMVFVDVIFQAMDTEWSYRELTKKPYDVASSRMLKRGDLDVSQMSLEVDAKKELDFLCVYQHTEHLLLRSTLLRKLLSYERPLVLVLAGDADCRLTTEVLTNATNQAHTLIFPNDGACASQVDGANRRRLWWPEGLEGFEGVADVGPLQSQGGFAADAGAVLDARQFFPVAAMRPFLLDAKFSVTPRKPARVHLVDYLERRGGQQALLALANATGFRVRLHAQIGKHQKDGKPQILAFDSRTSTTTTVEGPPRGQRKLTEEDEADSEEEAEEEDDLKAEEEDDLEAESSSSSSSSESASSSSERGSSSSSERGSSSSPRKRNTPPKDKDSPAAAHPRREEEESQPTDDDDEYEAVRAEDEGGDARSIFALAPAGDTWSSGRVLEAMLRGAIPIVDATYRSDGGASSKGCRDPAKFWREGNDDFPYGAPFVFVDDWDDLPHKLGEVLFVEDAVVDIDGVNRRLAAVRQYRDRLVAYLRNATLSAVREASEFSGTPSRRSDATCVETPLEPAERKKLLVDAADYYSADKDWFSSFEDDPSYPGSGCTTKYFTDGRKWHGAMCFDKACAPPTVKSFQCRGSSTADATTTTTPSDVVEDDVIVGQEEEEEEPQGES